MWLITTEVGWDVFIWVSDASDFLLLLDSENNVSLCVRVCVWDIDADLMIGSILTKFCLQVFGQIVFVDFAHRQMYTLSKLEKS